MRMTFAGHEVDLQRQELRRDGAPLHVEPQVFDLIVHLLRHRDRVVSKDELFDTIWNGRIVSEAALSSRINAARKAVGDDGDRQAVIRTIHKRGFRFVAEVEEVPNEAPGPGADPAPATIPARLATPLPAPRAATGRPSIVVLPFVTIGPEQDAQYFSYGLTEDIIRQLARYRWLEVLSRHSGAGFSGSVQTPQDIGGALGVRYLVQGSVAKRGERVRITADLVSAETGEQLWSDTHALALPEILDIQATMAEQIAATIEPELARLEREAAARRPPEDFNAWDCYQRGLWHLWGFTTPGMTEAEAMFRHAIEIDPGFARAHGALAYVHLQSAVLGPPEARPALLDEAMREARVAVTLDDQDCMNLCVLGRAHAFRRDYREAVALLEQAIALNPSFAQAWFALGFTLVFCGRHEEASACLERATDLSPRDPHLSSFHAMRALAHLALGDLDAAVDLARQGRRVPNAKHWPYAILAAALGLKRDQAAAQEALAELLEKQPGYSIAMARSDFFFCADGSLVELFVQGLREAGVAEGREALQAGQA
ncbi:winged helix-turn-helix domain-containing tetratricopeptide repeat protein [Falsiroseomonas sp. HC035]|uniref:winged helix-turn-helix domain-containing tetratricopeptide repeat protein n=1 Tax=Falsiroseomonas sp. HC035 TaxID=3390999 RepID=UPI003D320B05